MLDLINAELAGLADLHSVQRMFFSAAAVLFTLGVVGTIASAAQTFLTWWWVRKGPNLESSLPGISILKPLCGIDDDLEKNLEHFAALEYPNYEVLLGVKNEKDPAYPLAVAATQKWPNIYRLFLQRGEPGLNPKVNQLCTLEREAKHQILLVSDSNCRTPKGYLHEIAAAFEDPKVACFTNPIVGIGENKIGSLMDNFHLGASVASGMIAAKLAPLFSHDIVVGKSMAMRKSALDAIGGFYAARNHLAEDYVLGRGIHDDLKMKVAHGRLPVFQVSQNRTFKDFVNRHKRWCVIHRTAIRAHTYFGEGMMNTTPWGLAAFLLFPSKLFFFGFLAIWAVKTVLDSINTRQFRSNLFGWKTPFLVLLKDVTWGFTWSYGAVVRTVNWRGNKLRVHHGSQLIPPTTVPAPVALPTPVPAVEYEQRRNVA